MAPRIDAAAKSVQLVEKFPEMKLCIPTARVYLLSSNITTDGKMKSL